VERFGGNPSRGPVLRWDGTHKNDPEIGRSVPAEVVEISSLKLAEKMVQGGKLLQLPDLKIVDFGQGKLTTFVHHRFIRGSDITGR
jgi:hypothetical protein